MTGETNEGPDFDVDEFLSRPLIARVATSDPTIRPIWYSWEDGAFWWLTGSYSRLANLLERDANLALVVDTCDLHTGNVYQVVASGAAEVVPLDVERAVRKLTRYLGGDQSVWDPRFKSALYEDDSTRMIRLEPSRLRARDLSFSPGISR